ncbi:MAG TPA: ribosome silencing factor [Xanthomonadales bacterium]|nr:ribosome silencing factor [Xanthomonadales bacterium]
MTNTLKHTQKIQGKTPEEPSFQDLRQLVLSSLEDFKAIDIQEIDVSAQNSLTDLFVLASGNSSRHVQSMAENLVVKAKAAGCQPLGIEGEKEGEWVLVDLNDIIVHLMQPKTRAFYNLEKLWEAGTNRRSSAATPS